MDEIEIINLQKRSSKTKAAAKTGAKAVPKAPKRRYHLFLREQLDKMTGEDRQKYRSIVSRRWQEIKEDPARLSAYNDRARQMKNEAEKPGDDSKAPKTPEFVDTDSSIKDEQGSAVKSLKKAPKLQGFLIQAQALRMNKSLQ